MQTKGMHFLASKLWIFYVLFIIQMFLQAPADLGFAADGSTCLCSSCEECTSALRDPTCSTVLLDQNIDDGYTAYCIDSFNEKTFDCQGKEIIGGWNRGINLIGSTGATVKNCNLKGHWWPVYVSNSSSISLTDINILDARGISRVTDSTEVTIERLSIQGSPFDGGLEINSTSNLILKDSHFEGAKYWGLGTSGVNNSIIEGCTATNNGHGGMAIAGSNIQLHSNRVYGHTSRGITISGREFTLRDNELDGNGFNFGVGASTVEDFASMDIDASNTVDLRPIIYWVGVADVSVPINAGYVGIIDSQRVTVSGLELTRNGQGVLFVGTHDSTIEQMKLYGNIQEITLRFSDRNTIRDNIIGDINLYPYDPNAGGIGIISSNENTILGNTISQHGGGVGLSDTSQNNLVKENNIFENNQGIGLQWVEYNTIEKNTITDCINDGIRLGWNANNNTIIGNTVTGTLVRGINLYNANNNLVQENELIDNYYGIQVIYGSSSNTLTSNYVFENGSGIGLDSNSSANTLNDNFSCRNINYDMAGPPLNTGANNSCDNNSDWNDEGTTGCTYPCCQDQDDDGVYEATQGCPEGNDNCPDLSNPDQVDIDEDGIGDLCDLDFQVDGTLDPSDPDAYYVCEAEWYFGGICRAGVMNHDWYWNEWPTEATDVTLYVTDEPPPGLPGIVAPGTYFMNIGLDPEPLSIPYPPMGLSFNLPLLKPLPFSTVMDLMRVDPDTGELVPAPRWGIKCVNPEGCPEYSFEEDQSQWIPYLLPSADCYIWPYRSTPCPADVQDEQCGIFARCACVAAFSTVVGVVPDEISLPIDIMPGSDKNPINLKTKGVVPVAIFGRSSPHVADADGILDGGDFDIINLIDPATLNFHGASPKHNLAEPETLVDHRKDVNGDGFMDLLIHFNVQDITGLDKSSTEGCVEGSTKSGQSFKSCDSVKCK